jgi:pimeloyl-ACP methyl ester carboxylesterase
MRRLLTGALLALTGLAAPLPCAPAAPTDDPASYAGRGFAPVNGTRIFYEVRGEGEPLVLIHGGQLDSRMWDSQFDAYGRYFRVLRYDVRGFGGSPLGEGTYSHADDLAALMDYLDMPRAHLLGLSLGGMVATDFAVTYPGRVLSLVLSGPGLTGLDAESPEELARYFAEVVAARDAPPDSVVRLWLSDPLMAPAAADPRLRPRLERLARENARAWLNNWALRRPPGPPTIARFAEIHVPTLLLVGDRDLPSIFAAVDTLAKAIPGAKKVVIPGAGHMANMEKPGEFDAAVLGFLGKWTQAGR